MRRTIRMAVAALIASGWSSLAARADLITINVVNTGNAPQNNEEFLGFQFFNAKNGFDSEGFNFSVTAADVANANAKSAKIVAEINKAAKNLKAVDKQGSFTVETLDNSTFTRALFSPGTKPKTTTGETLKLDPKNMELGKNRGFLSFNIDLSG